MCFCAKQTRVHTPARTLTSGVGNVFEPKFSPWKTGITVILPNRLFVRLPCNHRTAPAHHHVPSCPHGHHTIILIVHSSWEHHPLPRDPAVPPLETACASCLIGVELGWHVTRLSHWNMGRRNNASLLSLGLMHYGFLLIPLPREGHALGGLLVPAQWKALGADLDPTHSLEPCPAELSLDQPKPSQPSNTWPRRKYSLATTELWNGFVKQHYCDNTLCLSCPGHGDLSLLKALKWAHFSFTPGPPSLNAMKSTWVLQPERCRPYLAPPSCWLSSLEQVTQLL